MKRKLLCGLLAALTLTCATVKAAPSRVVPVQVDGTVLSQGVNYLQSGVTYVPLRGLLDAFGGNEILALCTGCPLGLRRYHRAGGPLFWLPPPPAASPSPQTRPEIP